MDAQVEFRPQSAALISTTIVVNIIWWMVMIAAIYLGATHLGSCPLQPNIPIYLIVLGAGSIVSLCMTYTRSIMKDGCIYILTSVCTAFLHILSFCWFIAGTVWVYPIYPPNYTPGAAPYCQKTTYLFAFVVTTLVWATMALMFVCGFCFSLVTCCTTVTARHRLIPSRSSFYGAVSDEPTAGDV
ncbi:transmembrane protein 272-like [Morone saxatilis]|uniref:transmembrane protein 272-like n=1 Tax=Morone saxatilis TaxID=34816 RepID=UPI0015E1BCC9|nr:transmembrane protein 272-like [Morone saxatilis]